MRYIQILLTIIAVTLLFIAEDMDYIRINLLDEFRPVRNYNVQYVVASVDSLSIMDDWASQQRVR
jgi:hypothetical protein